MYQTCREKTSKNFREFKCCTIHAAKETLQLTFDVSRSVQIITYSIADLLTVH